MELKKQLLMLATSFLGMAAFAQTDPVPGTIHAYLVGKQDANTVVISEVIQATEQMVHRDLLGMYNKLYPDTPLPKGVEALRFATLEEAQADRLVLKAKYEKAGRSVTLRGEEKK